MDKAVCSIIVFLTFLLSVQATPRTNNLSVELKEDYFREMASRETDDVDIRLMWYDSLLNLPVEDKLGIQIRKIELLQKSGYTFRGLALAESILDNNDKIPLDRLLPLSFYKAGCQVAERDLGSAMAEYEDILSQVKPDSLKYWDIEAAFEIAKIYIDLNDYISAADWLNKVERKISAYPLSTSVRKTMEARLHGNRATILIARNKLDSAYKEIKIVRSIADPQSEAQTVSLLQLGQIYMAKNQIGSAERYVEQAVKAGDRGQTGRSAIYMLAHCYIKEKKFREALEILNSYPAATIKSNSMRNLVAYYALRGQAYDGCGKMDLAYNSLDSALVVTDTIFSHITRYQAQNAGKYVKMRQELKTALRNVKTLSTGIIISGTGTVITGLICFALLLRSRKLHRKMEEDKDDVTEARLILEEKQRKERISMEDKDAVNRRQTALLLRMAQFENVLDSIRKKLTTEELDKTSRSQLLRQLQEINGKERIWELFSMQFEVTNRKFLDLLADRHPELTKSERRICAFMLLNLSTKEIADLLGRSPRTVDVTKYNLRKKLAPDTSTEEYLRRLAEEASKLR